MPAAAVTAVRACVRAFTLCFLQSYASRSIIPRIRSQSSAQGDELSGSTVAILYAREKSQYMTELNVLVHNHRAMKAYNLR